MSEFIEFMVGTSLITTSLSCGRQSSAIPCAMHSYYSEPSQYRTRLNLDRPVPAGTDPGRRARFDVGSAWPFRFATMTESITSPHNRHCHPEVDSPLTTSFMLMIRRNPSQREQVMPITWHPSPGRHRLQRRDLVRSSEPAKDDAGKQKIVLVPSRHEIHDGLGTWWLPIRPITSQKGPTEERRRLGNQTRRGKSRRARDRTVSEAQYVMHSRYAQCVRQSSTIVGAWIVQ
jgi:hypothetical protein